MEFYSFFWLLMQADLKANLQSTSKKGAGFKWTKWLKNSSILQQRCIISLKGHNIISYNIVIKNYKVN